MGIVKNPQNKSILEKYDFIKGHVYSYADENDSEYYYHNYPVSSFYDMFVEVNLSYRKVYLTMEYDCGGVVFNSIEYVPENIEIQSEEFIDWLDELVEEFKDGWED